jgi:tetratricopeptide (TPR) repeat protein
MNPIKLFYSYSHKDETLKDKLVTHLAVLKRQGLIEEWNDRQIGAGDEWKGEIDEHLEEADIVLLLVSPDFIASDYCYDIEMTRALARHDGGDARVIPVILKRTPRWTKTPFGKLQALPNDGAPVTGRKWKNQGEALGDIADGIAAVVEELGIVPEAKVRANTDGAPNSLGAGLYGREFDLSRIGRAFAKDGCRAVVVYGRTGVGKSQIAADYAAAQDVQTYWTTAGADLDLTFFGLSETLGVFARSDDASIVAEEVKTLLNGMPDETLVVIDNVQDVSLCRAVAEAVPGKQFLFTTRTDDLAELPGPYIPIGLVELQIKPAIDLLESRGYAGEDNGSLTEIAETVGRLPLALESLAIELGRGRATAAGVLKGLRASPNPIQFKVFQEAPGFAIKRKEGVFQALVNPLRRLRRSTRRRIEPLGYVGETPISFSLLEALLGVEEGRKEWDEGLAECQRESIVELSGGRARVHALTAAAIAATNPRGRFERALQRFHGRMHSVYEATPLVFLDEEPHYRSSVEWSAKIIGREEGPTLASRNLLALAYGKVGRLEDRVRIHELDLTIRERLSGSGHPETLTVRNNLASAYGLAGRLEDAIRLHKVDLPWRERLLGPEHPDTLNAWNNLALVYSAAGRLEDSVHIFEKNLPGIERALGAEHPDTLNARNNLAVAYGEIGRLEESVHMHEINLPLTSKVLGAEHPGTLGARNNLALAYGKMGRVEEEARMHEESLPVDERILGPEHPSTLRTKYNLAIAYGKLGDSDTLIQSLESVVPAFSQALGKDHPDTLKAREDLIVAYRQAGRENDALRLEE